MVDDVDRMKKEIDRLERQEAIENEMNRPTASPILSRPENPITGEDRKGRASDSYRKAFWQNMRSKSVSHEVFNALQIGTDSEGGYLVPDEYDRTLVETLQEENIFRRLAHSSPRNPATARSPWSRPRARPAGSTRKRRIPKATTALDRFPSARTSWRP